MHRFIITKLVTQVSPSVEVSLSRMRFKKVAYIGMVKINCLLLISNCDYDASALRLRCASAAISSQNNRRPISNCDCHARAMRVRGCDCPAMLRLGLGRYIEKYRIVSPISIYRYRIVSAIRISVFFDTSYRIGGDFRYRYKTIFFQSKQQFWLW
jgi:hypothetical protein